MGASQHALDGEWSQALEWSPHGGWARGRPRVAPLRVVLRIVLSLAALFRPSSVGLAVRACPATTTQPIA
jgi:hypothetical protein